MEAAKVAAENKREPRERRVKELENDEREEGKKLPRWLLAETEKKRKRSCCRERERKGRKGSHGYLLSRGGAQTEQGRCTAG